MCGIVGIVGTSDVAQRLFDGLKRLEYRGYDSAGICTIDGGELVRRRAEGKLDNLARELKAEPLHGEVGIAHTRWATHGAPTVGNAHPHIVGPRGAGPQRHHREFQAAARRTDRRGARVQQRDRHRGRRPSRRARDRARGLARGRGRGGLAAASGRLRHRLPVPRLPRPDHRRAAGRAADRRLWRGRELPRLRRARGRALDPAHRLSRGGRLGGGAARGDRDFRPRQPPGHARDRRIRRVVGAGREGQLRPLHAKGDFRAADRGRAELSKATSGRSKAKSRCRSPRPIWNRSTG